MKKGGGGSNITYYKMLYRAWVEQAVVNTIMNHQVPWGGGEFLDKLNY